MKLESLESLPNSDKVKLHLSDGSCLRVPRVTAADAGLCVGMELDEETLRRLSERAAYDSTRLRAVRILGASATSEKDLRRKLLQKGENKENTERTIAWLNDLQLIDDRETALRIAERAGSRGYGAARVRQILYEKGIPKEYWEEALSRLPDPSEEILRYLRAHLSCSDPDRKEKKKISDALIRRGYSWDAIRRGFETLQISSEEEF